MLLQAGFTIDYAEFLLRRVDTEKARARRLDATVSIKARYLSHLIEDVEARNSLLSIGYNNNRAGELIDRWFGIRISNAKLPSKTDLDKLLKHDIITEDDYQGEMAKLGYSKRYVAWYLSLAKSGAEG